MYLNQAQQLNKDERTDLLRRHPALSARLFHYKQDCIWKCILQGASKPVGEIVDYWRRVEVILNVFSFLSISIPKSLLTFHVDQFQMRGTPHVHSLVCIKHYGIGPETAESTDKNAIRALKNLIKETISAELVDRYVSDTNDLTGDELDQEKQMIDELDATY